MHVILQTNHSSFSINAPWPSRSRQRGRCQLEMVNKLLIQLPYVDDQRPTGTFALALELDALRERTHVRNPNPGSRRARLAGAVHRDDRHLDPGTGKFVTDFLKLKHAGYRPQIFVSATGEAAPDDWRRALLQSPGAR
jgi:hypothetical protein